MKVLFLFDYRLWGLVGLGFSGNIWLSQGKCGGQVTWSWSPCSGIHFHAICIHLPMTTYVSHISFLTETTIITAGLYTRKKKDQKVELLLTNSFCSSWSAALPTMSFLAIFSLHWHLSLGFAGWLPSRYWYNNWAQAWMALELVLLALIGLQFPHT